MNILRRYFERLAEKFWVVPALITAFGVGGAEVLVYLDRSGRVPDWMIQSQWVYTGGATGARTLLGTVASSMIGVAGTVFSITIAALTLAAGQMGPRLLRNFTNDRGNQITLGVFLGTFSYASMVLRSVRTADEGLFIPHASLSVGILLAFLCVATLVYFVGHMANRINVDTVIELVSNDVHASIDRLAVDKAQAAPPADSFWDGGTLVTDRVSGNRQGYLQAFDRDRLTADALEKHVSIRLFVRPGHYVFPGTTVAVIKPDGQAVDTQAVDTKTVAKAINTSFTLGPERVSAEDLEFPIRQLVEVAVRALSPGINDLRTAMSVLDRLGAALCDLAGPPPVHRRHDRRQRRPDVASFGQLRRPDQRDVPHDPAKRARLDPGADAHARSADCGGRPRTRSGALRNTAPPCRPGRRRRHARHPDPRRHRRRSQAAFDLHRDAARRPVVANRPERRRRRQTRPLSC